MCGIVGVFPLVKSDCPLTESQRKDLAFFLHNEILYHTLERGKHATGIAASWGPLQEGGAVQENDWAILKQPVDSEDFLANNGSQIRYSSQKATANMQSFMNYAHIVPRKLNCILGHCRHKTIGTEKDFLNNHPIITGEIIGIHNGGIKNHNDLFKKNKDTITRIGDVDSEIIFQLLALEATGRSLCMDDLDAVNQQLEGAVAAVAFNKKHPETVAFFRGKERPLEISYLSEAGLLVVSSKTEYVSLAVGSLLRAGLALRHDMPRLTISRKTMPINEGAIVDLVTDFTGKNTLYDVLQTKNLAAHVRSAVASHSARNSSSSTNYNYSATAINDKAKVVEIDFKPSSKDKDEAAPKDTSSSEVMGKPVAIEDVEEGSTLSGLLSYEEKKRQGITALLSADQAIKEGSFLKQWDGNFSNFLCVQGLSEEVSREIAQKIYPEAGGDGFALGYDAGSLDAEKHFEAEVQQLEDELEGVSTEVQEFERKTAEMQENLTTQEGQLKRAASCIANIKSFLFAALLSSNTLSVSNDKLAIDASILDFIKNTPGFDKVNVNMVMEMFSEKNKRLVEEYSDSPDEAGTSLQQLV